MSRIAYYFKSLNLSGGEVRYNVYFNRGLTRGRDLLPLMNVVANALWNYYRGESAALLVPLPTLGATPAFPCLALAAHVSAGGTRAYPSYATPNDFDFISAFGPTLYIFMFMLLFPVFLEALVAEKENRLREIMKMVRLSTAFTLLAPPACRGSRSDRWGCARRSTGS